MDIELVTDVDRLQHFVDGWERWPNVRRNHGAAGAIVAAWARHMMAPGRRSCASGSPRDGSDVVGVLPFVAETMARGRVRLLPPLTDMMYGTVPVAHPGRAQEVAEAIAEDFAGRAEQVDLASIFWLPEGSPWATAFGTQLAEPDWVAMDMAQYSSYYTNIGDGIEAWLGRRQRSSGGRCDAGPAAARSRGFGSTRPRTRPEIMQRLPQLQTLYVRRQEERGGEGYRFDDDMVEAIGHGDRASRLGVASRCRCSRVTSGDRNAAGPARRDQDELLDHGLRPRVVPARARYRGAARGARLPASQAGCEIADLGVGDQPYKDDIQDAAFDLESVTWCRPRLARLLQCRDSTDGSTPDGDRR